MFMLFFTIYNNVWACRRSTTKENGTHRHTLFSFSPYLTGLIQVQTQNTNPNWMGVYDGDKNKRAGKWRLQLIYRFSYPNERPGVWMAVILVCLYLYQPKAERPCCKDGLLADVDLLWITFAFKKNYWCHWVLRPGRFIDMFSCTCDNLSPIHCLSRKRHWPASKKPLLALIILFVWGLTSHSLPCFFLKNGPNFGWKLEKTVYVFQSAASQGDVRLIHHPCMCPWHWNGCMLAPSLNSQRSWLNLLSHNVYGSWNFFVTQIYGQRWDVQALICAQ